MQVRVIVAMTLQAHFDSSISVKVIIQTAVWIITLF